MDESVLFWKSEMYIWVFYLLGIFCLLFRGIEKLLSKELVIKCWSNSNPEFFEFEVGCFLQGAWKTNGWWILMIFQVIAVLSISWDRHSDVHKKNKVCLKWCLIDSCQGRWLFLYDQIWSHQCYSQILSWIWILLLQICFSCQYVQTVLQRIPEVQIDGFPGQIFVIGNGLMCHF